jgi:hypothetical protein
VPTTITCNTILKIKILERFDEKDQIEEADETEQNAENVLTAITCVHLLKIKTEHKFDKVTAERDKTEELYVEQQHAVHTALASHKYIKNNHTVLKKISVQAVTKKDETEVLKYVESKKAGSAVLAAIKTAKTEELDAQEEFEENHVLKQKADDADPEPEHHHRDPVRDCRAQQDCRGVHRTRV